MAEIEGRYLVYPGSKTRVKLPWQATEEQIEVSRRRLMWLIDHPGTGYPAQLQQEMFKHAIGFAARLTTKGATAPVLQVCLFQWYIKGRIIVDLYILIIFLSSLSIFLQVIFFTANGDAKTGGVIGVHRCTVCEVGSIGDGNYVCAGTI